ncbi:hypothetical protein C0Q70_04614 [Pomacea canaliculata]|uniref:Uncharacterized protein n=1 Tax=Pomacea canaliculata TaxID=400727 RepID=A0A2T7PIZ2_POMCA|nr:hypothetical protein C0Q70_04614 [Pomacea canaliculata]
MIPYRSGLDSSQGACAKQGTSFWCRGSARKITVALSTRKYPCATRYHCAFHLAPPSGSIDLGCRALRLWRRPTVTNH